MMCRHPQSAIYKVAVSAITEHHQAISYKHYTTLQTLVQSSYPNQTQPTTNSTLKLKQQTTTMQTSIIIATLFTAIALAAPARETDSRQTPYVACSGLYGTSQCCATDVLGVADLDCANPPSVPNSADNFSAVCAAIGQRARCCVLPVLGQDVLCQTPSGVQG
ncbi:Cerato-ulmin hydrophobin family [Xylaria telfairii]|nr:Cerato-ulmin hydrophobin family [Xylaria telfairii]